MFPSPIPETQNTTIARAARSRGVHCGRDTERAWLTATTAPEAPSAKIRPVNEKGTSTRRGSSCSGMTIHCDVEWKVQSAADRAMENKNQKRRARELPLPPGEGGGEGMLDSLAWSSLSELRDCSLTYSSGPGPHDWPLTLTLSRRERGSEFGFSFTGCGSVGAGPCACPYPFLREKTTPARSAAASQEADVEKWGHNPANTSRNKTNPERVAFTSDVSARRVFSFEEAEDRLLPCEEIHPSCGPQRLVGRDTQAAYRNADSHAA